MNYAIRNWIICEQTVQWFDDDIAKTYAKAINQRIRKKSESEKT